MQKKYVWLLLSGIAFLQLCLLLSFQHVQGAAEHAARILGHVRAVAPILGHRIAVAAEGMRSRQAEVQVVILR
jgi:hypothetical protein